jgi:microcystin-dependent protein
MATFKITDLTNTDLPTLATVIPCIQGEAVEGQSLTDFVTKQITIGQIRDLFDVSTVKTVNAGIGTTLSSFPISTSGTVSFNAPGLMCLFAGTHVAGSPNLAIPSGWLECNGQAVSKTGDTAALFAAIGIKYGGTPGGTTFNLPNLSGRALCGLDTVDASAAGVLTQTWCGSGRNTLGGTAGAKGVTLTQEQIPLKKHYHTLSSTFTDGYFRNGRGGATRSGAGLEYDFSTTSGGGRNVSLTLPLTISNPSGGASGVSSSTEHSHLPPFILLRYIIKT